MGIWITEDLLRKSSEHNDCIISTLEEITLHQREIDRITLLNSACRELRIIYLQNNNISKIENINRLKELRYLNLAINRVRQFEGLHRCEFLQKLDMTLNRVDARGLLTIERLKANTMLTELYMTGNTGTLIKGADDVDVYRPFVIALLPSLESLDGKEVLKSERTQALQMYDYCRSVIEKVAESEEALPEARHPMDMSDSEDEDIEEISTEEKGEPYVSPFEGFGKTAKVKATTPGVDTRGADGKIRQCNEGHYKFHVEEKDDVVLVELFVSKFLDTSLMDVDVHPDFIRITVKGKVTQLQLPQEVRTDNAHCQRSKTTGALLVTCPRMNPVMRRQKLVGVAPDRHEETAARRARNGTNHSLNPVASGSDKIQSMDQTDFRRIAKNSPAADLSADMTERKMTPLLSAAAAQVDDDAPPDF